MSKIIRTKTRVEGGITPEENALMEAHSKLWIERAFRTDPIEPDKIIPAIEGIYAAAGLKKPRVVIVPSPLVMAFAYGASAAIWHKRKNGGTATRNATNDATRNATYNATRNATRNATLDATDIATRNATLDATYNATDNATNDATNDATRNATYNATYNATRNATDIATFNATDNATDDATHNATLIATDDATRTATDDATRTATRIATDDATRTATRTATLIATDDATLNATLIATHDATYNETDAATRIATRDATRNATRNATHAGAIAACLERAGDFGLRCARNWSNSYQGGNMWAGYESYLTAFRDILGLDLPEHKTYAHWEAAAIHGGFRVLHEEFCLVCDFPEFIHIDEQNRPHSETGPSHQWRDGWKLYHWHGVPVPDHWIEDRENLTAEEVIRAENVEQRAAGMQIIGPAKMVAALDRKIIDGDPNSDIGALIELTLPGLDQPGRFLQAVCPRNGTICEGVPYMSDIDNQPINTALAAQAWRVGLTQTEYRHPPKRT